MKKGQNDMYRNGENKAVDTLDDGLKKSAQKMHSAGDALLATGFDENHWCLIRDYIDSAILNSQFAILKSAADLAMPDLNS
jgi:hypothetical protein